MEIFIELLKEVNIVQILILLVAGSIFYNRLKKEFKIETVELKIEISKLSDKVEDIDRRLCRIEGSLATQGHCLFSQNQSEKKAE